MTYSIIPYESNVPVKQPKTIILKKRKYRAKRPKVTVIGGETPSPSYATSSKASQSSNWSDVTWKNTDISAMAKAKTKQENKILRDAEKAERKKLRMMAAEDKRRQKSFLRAKAASTRKHKRIARKIWRRLI